jgi:catechol 2,3-dioxygenase-like lactoylglutathione lyase family enzyme
MLKIGVICLNAADWRRAAKFWTEALGYTPHPQAADILVPPGGVGPQLAVYQRDRTHLDLYTASRDEQQAEVERLISLGAERVPDWPYPDGADFVVLRDTEGNLFCVIDHG